MDHGVIILHDAKVVRVVQDVAAIVIRNEQAHLVPAGNIDRQAADGAVIPRAARGSLFRIDPTVGEEVGPRGIASLAPHAVVNADVARRGVRLVFNARDGKVSVRLSLDVKHGAIPCPTGLAVVWLDRVGPSSAIGRAVRARFSSFANVISAAQKDRDVEAAKDVRPCSELRQAARGEAPARKVLAVQVRSALVEPDLQVGSSRQSASVDGIHLDLEVGVIDNAWHGKLGVRRARIQQADEPGLGVAYPIVALDLNHVDQVVCEVILQVGSGGAVEPHEYILGSACLYLYGDWLVTSEVVLAHAHHVALPGGIHGIERDFGVIVPAVDLEVLGGVEAHIANLIAKKRVAHHASVVGVAADADVASTPGDAIGARVGKVESMSHLVDLDSRIGDIISLVHLAP
mmetsp:Transcript_41107/g.74124  ORF Transcript_41107/g.74124 Transcript_41107/m.74124 type:complete len:402 (-) Transcript_41107:1135-2340(-)